MKKMILGFLSSAIVVFSMAAFADKIIIAGTPVTLTQQGDTYVMSDPNAMMDTSKDYYYFTVGDTKKVCYTAKSPTLTMLTPNMMAVKIGSDVKNLYCYDYSPDYFTIQTQ